MEGEEGPFHDPLPLVNERLFVKQERMAPTRETLKESKGIKNMFSGKGSVDPWHETASSSSFCIDIVVVSGPVGRCLSLYALPHIRRVVDGKQSSLYCNVVSNIEMALLNSSLTCIALGNIRWKKPFAHKWTDCHRQQPVTGYVWR